MKKSILLLTLSLAATGLSLFASPATGKDPKTESAFKKQFAGASHVQWSTTAEGYAQAAFTWANHRTIAYFTPEAEFVGSARNLFFGQLPLSVMRSIESKFGSESLLEITEITNGEGTFYSLLIEQKNKRLKVRLGSSGEIVQKEKVKK